MRKTQPNPGVPTGRVKIPAEVHLTTEEVGRKVNEILGVGSDAPIPPGKADPEQIFLLFAAFGGDIFKSAHACGVTPEEVTRLAEEGKWLERIRALIELKKGEKGVDVERGISRAINFVQANRYRLVLERVIRHIDRLPDDELMEQFKTRKVAADGTAVVTGLSLRILADIATALEKTHWLTYQALLDAPQDRAGRREKSVDDGPGEEDVHAKIAKALAGMGDVSPREQMDKTQALQIADLTKDMQSAQPNPPES